PGLCGVGHRLHLRSGALPARRIRECERLSCFLLAADQTNIERESIWRAFPIRHKKIFACDGRHNQQRVQSCKLLRADRVWRALPVGTGPGPSNRRVVHQPLRFNSAALRALLTKVTLDSRSDTIDHKDGLTDRVLKYDWFTLVAPE